MDIAPPFKSIIILLLIPIYREGVFIDLVFFRELYSGVLFRVSHITKKQILTTDYNNNEQCQWSVFLP